MGGGDNSVTVSEDSPGQDEDGQERRGLGEDKSTFEAGQEKKWISDILTKQTLRLLEFLITEKEEYLYSLSDLAEELGVSVSTVSRAYRRLLDVGILVESHYPRGNTGRPITVIELDNDNPMVEILSKWIRAFSIYLHSLKETD